MKFGNLLKENIENEYLNYYIPYNDMKKNIIIDPTKFLNILFHYLDISEDFYISNNSKYNLINFSLLNIFAVLKITKKYNKKNKYNITDRVRVKLHKQKFYKDLLNKDILKTDKTNKTACIICYDIDSYMVNLKCCNHSVCWNCLLKCYLNDFNSCSYCRRPIETNPLLLSMKNLTKTNNTFYKEIINNEENKKLLVIAIDGLRPDALLFANTPILDKFIKDSSFNFETIINADTVSAPSWSTMFTGLNQEEHEIHFNETVEDIHFLWKTNNIFKDLKKKNVKVNSFSNNWIGMKHMLQDSDNNIFIDTKDKYFNDFSVINKTKEHIIKNKHSNELIFSYINGIDETGHNYGFSIHSPHYIDYIEYIDSIIEDLLNIVVNNNISCMIITDHGGSIKKDLDNKQTNIFDSIDNVSGQIKKNLKGIHGLDIPQHKRVFQIFHGDIINNQKKELIGNTNSIDIYNRIINFF